MLQWLIRTWLRVTALVRRSRLDRDLGDEIGFHLAMREERLREAGLSAEAARTASRRQFGNPALVQETCREMWGFPWAEDLQQDIRYGARALRRNPAFAAVVVATIALGIGASTAVFSVVDPLLFRHLPYPKDDQMVSVGYLGPVDNNEFNVVSSYFDWRQADTLFQSLTAMRPGTGCDLSMGDAPQEIQCYAVADNFLRTLGIAPLIGRDFTQDDNRPQAPTVALLSYGFWRRAFGGDEKALGKTLVVNDGPARVIGVLPPQFEMPQLGEVDVMLPARLNPGLPRSVNSSSFLRTFARLREGVTIDQARDQLRPLFEESKAKDVPPELRSEARLVVRSLRDRQIQDVKLASWLLVGSVLGLLLVACANVANLMLARSEARRQELAMRATLGAGRLRLMRQTLTEALMFGLLGGIVGCGAAWVLLRIFVSLAFEEIPRLAQAHIDSRVLLFALAGSLAAAVLFGMVPALERPRAESLMGWQVAGSGRALFRKVLVAAQVAISMVLLTGASLLIRSLTKLESQPLGFAPEHLISASFETRHRRPQVAAAQTAIFDELETSLRRIPGGGSFALSDSIPPRGAMGRPYSNIRIAGHQALAADGGLVEFRWVSPGYFRTMGIAIQLGREFDEAERASGESPVILSAALARRMFGSQNPVGQKLELDGNGHWCPIVGVAADTKNNGLTAPPYPEYYRLRMKHSDQFGRSGVAIFRTSLDPSTLTRWVRKEFAEIDPTLAVTIETMDTRLGRFQERPRFAAILVGLFAALGLSLAAVGLYGVLSFQVARQTREIGVRMAIGARPQDIAVQVQKFAAAWTAGGVAAGLAGSFALARTIRGLLFEISPTDPVAIATAVLVLVATAGLAAWFPSYRAARVDPVVALRSQ